LGKQRDLKLLMNNCSQCHERATPRCSMPHPGQLIMGTDDDAVFWKRRRARGHNNDIELRRCKRRRQLQRAKRQIPKLGRELPRARWMMAVHMSPFRSLRLYNLNLYP
jgi:hypothetical protein